MLKASGRRHARFVLSPARVSGQQARGQEGIELRWQFDKARDRLSLIRTNKADRGEFTNSAHHYYWQVEATQKPESAQGFVPQTGRWQVERSFAWFNFLRRLSRDFKKQ